MFAEVEITGALSDPEFWHSLFLVVTAVAGGLVVLLMSPTLVGRVVRAARSRATRRGSTAAATKEAASGRRTQSRHSVAADQRRHQRRSGHAKRILLRVGRSGKVPLTCWVTNRSRGGLSIVAEQPFAPLTIVEVRPGDAPDDVPWVKLEVRSCRPKADRWYLGCRFTEELPWAVVLLFG
jgi:hypothetical protein